MKVVYRLGEAADLEHYQTARLLFTSLLKVKCDFCNKVFIRSLGRVNESKKFNWKFYCSSDCQYKAKEKRKSFGCFNPNCNKTFSRTPNEIRSQNLFCSQSCAAIINNKLRAVKTKVRICPVCNKNFYGAKKYCSRKCFIKVANQDRKIPIDEYKQKVISRFIRFYKEYKRIPLKRELYGMYGTARKLFGTWNNAVKAAGLKPNPVLFAKKFIANDGHKCDSLSEKIIDDWLYARKIKHSRNIFYPNSQYKADFVINRKFVEFLGLIGEVKKYDKNVREKEKIAIQNSIDLIKIYPKDLFPKSNLHDILKFK